MNKEDFKGLIRESHLRLSHPRFLIFQELSGAIIPLSPQELYQSLHRKKKKIGLTSIYRCLDLFESLGIVFKTIDKPMVRYQLCESGEHHHHITCKRCGKTMELLFCGVSDWSQRVTESTGYQVTEHQLRFYGYCESCQEKP